MQCCQVRYRIHEPKVLRQSPIRSSARSRCFTDLSKKNGRGEKRFYSTTATFNLIDNNLLLVTTAVDPRYRLSVFPSELKENVEKLLQMEVKKYSRREARQRGDSVTDQRPNISKPPSSSNFVT